MKGPFTLHVLVKVFDDVDFPGKVEMSKASKDLYRTQEFECNSFEIIDGALVVTASEEITVVAAGFWADVTAERKHD